MRKLSMVKVLYNDYNSFSVIQEALKKVTTPKGITPSYKHLRFIYLGEIPNMRGHGIFIETLTGKHLIGVHIDSFKELSEDDNEI